MFRIIAVIYFSIAAIHVFAQEKVLRFNHITTIEGLPYCNIIKMFTAADNMLWISTSVGLYYYDGKKVKPFIVPGHSDFFGGWTNYIVEGSGNKLYVGSVKGLLYINATDLTSSIPRLYKVHDRFQPFYTEPLCEDKKGNLWIYSGHNSASLYKLNLKDTSLQFIINDINGVLSVIKNPVDGSPAGIWYRENKGAYYISFNTPGTTIADRFFTGKSKDDPSLYINDVVAIDSISAWVATPQGLYHVNRQTKKIKLCNLGNGRKTDNIRSLARGKNGLIYCATSNNGILVYNPVNDKVVTQYKHYDQDRWSIPGNNTEYIYIDDKDHLFVATANQGISYTSLSDSSQLYYKLLTYDNEPAISFNDRITMVALQKDLTYSYVEEKGLYITGKDHIIQKIIPGSITGKINQLFQVNKDTLWAATDKGLFYIINRQITPVTVASELHTPRVYKVCLGYNKKIMVAGDAGIYFVETTNGQLTLKNYVINPKIGYPFFMGLFEYKPGQFLLNTKYTSFYTATCQNDTIRLLTETRGIDIVPLDYRNISDSQIMINCTNGTYIYNLTTNSLINTTEQKNKAYMSFFYSNQNNYALTADHITRFKLSENDKQLLVAGFQNIISGVYSPVHKTDSSQWLAGTSGGWVQFDLKKTAQPYHYIFTSDDDHKNIWHPLTHFTDSLTLSLSDNKTFFVSANNFNGSSALLYFKDDEHDHWQVFPNGEMIDLANLSGGWHTLNFNVYPFKEESISRFIFIPTPWYKKWWATLGEMLIVLTALFLIIKRITGNIQKAAMLKQHIIETEMAALKAQMNPHFMFNCINSIDAFIQSNDKYNATLYLNKFAKLIRNVLDSSKQNMVNFSKDIETLKLYIELEELRSENKFTTKLNIDEELMNSDFKVPPLIIQPFVENAIIHGLRNKETNDGLLLINISKTENHIVYAIMDNGIGRSASKHINTGKEQSYGLQMSYDRIKLFNKETTPSVVITDLYENEKATGTNVQVNLKII